jgi:hypothetical protein
VRGHAAALQNQRHPRYIPYDLFLDDLEKRRIKREAVKAERLRQRANQLVFLREHSTVKIGRRHMPR